MRCVAGLMPYRICQPKLPPAGVVAVARMGRGRAMLVDAPGENPARPPASLPLANRPSQESLITQDNPDQRTVGGVEITGAAGVDVRTGVDAWRVGVQPRH
jgi:hypothetical protein